MKNQATHDAMIGMNVQVYANQATRDGVVIAAVGQDALIEYVMPSGVCFLRILAIDEYGQINEDAARNASYKSIPKKFIQHMRANRARVANIFVGGFDVSEAPARKFWQRAHNDRLSQRAAATKVDILGEGDDLEEGNSCIRRIANI